MLSAKTILIMMTGTTVVMSTIVFGGMSGNSNNKETTPYTLNITSSDKDKDEGDCRLRFDHISNHIIPKATDPNAPLTEEEIKQKCGEAVQNILEQNSVKFFVNEIKAPSSIK